MNLGNWFTRRIQQSLVPFDTFRTQQVLTDAVTKLQKTTDDLREFSAQLKEEARKNAE